MSERFQLPVAFWRLQYQLLGGNRRMGAVAVVYTSIVLVGLAAWRRIMADDPFSSLAGGMATALAVIQGLLLSMGGSNAVYRATLRDYQTRMIESHRISPMSRLTVVLGYMFGAPLQVIMLFVINLCVGAIVTWMGGYSIPGWLSGNVFLVCGAVMLWAMSAFGGVGLGKPQSPAAILLCIGLLAFPVVMFPPAGMMSGAYANYVGVALVHGTLTPNRGELWVLIPVQLLLAAFWMWAACRRFRRPDLPAINAPAGFILTSLWLAFGAIGIVVFDQVMRVLAGPSRPDHFARPQWIATIVGGLILGAITVMGGVESRAAVIRGRQPRSAWDSVPDDLVSIIAAGLICGMTALVGISVWPGLLRGPFGTAGGFLVGGRVWLATIAACVFALLTVRGAMVLANSRIRPPKRTAIYLLVALWVGPPIVDQLRAALLLAEDPRAPATSWLTGLSPAGLVANAWMPGPIEMLAPGLLFQAALAIAVSAVAARIGRSRGHAVGPAADGSVALKASLPDLPSR